MGDIDPDEFDAHDIIPLKTAEPCWRCGKPSGTASLSFEAAMHRECADDAWAAYFEALAKPPQR